MIATVVLVMWFATFVASRGVVGMTDGERLGLFIVLVMTLSLGRELR